MGDLIDLDTLKTILQGLIVSNPGTMTVDTLCRDYRTSEGHELPYRQQGFRSPEEFLRSLRDTIEIRGYNVYAVDDQKMAHVESLVARTRSKSKRKGGGGGFHRVRTSRFQASRLPPRMTRFNNSSNGPSMYRNQENIRKTPITSLYRSGDGCTPQSEEVRTRSPEQNYRPNRYFDDISDCDSGDDPLDEFEVVNGNEPSRNCVDEEGYLDDFQTPSFDAVENFVHKPTDNDPLEEDRPSSCTLELGDIVKSKIASPKRSRGTVKDFLSGSEDDEDCLISDKMKENLKKIIEQYPSGLWCCNLPDEYLRRYGVPLDFRQFGFVGVSQMAMALPDIFRCVQVNDGDWKLFDARYRPPEHFLDTVYDHDTENSCDEPQVSAKVMERIKSVLSIKSKAISINDFIVNYMIIYGASVMDEVKGFKDVQSLLKCVSNDIVVVKEVTGETMLFPPSLEEDDSNVALPVELSWAEMRETMPPNACGDQDKCPQIVLPKTIEFGTYLPVRLAEIYNPLKFWIHICGPDHEDKLEALMDEMQEFYNENESSYVAPFLQWKRGDICVAMYSHEWHRAVIVSVIDKHRVKVKYFDYGTIEEVQKSELRLMDKSFNVLPMQAIKAKLSAIKPPKGAENFSWDASRFFFNLAASKKLVASVTKVLQNPPFLALTLVDTQGDEDIHINDELVERGYAEFSSTGSDGEWEESDESDEEDERSGTEVKQGNDDSSASPQKPKINEDMPPLGTITTSTANNNKPHEVQTDIPSSLNETAATLVTTQAVSSPVSEAASMSTPETSVESTSKPFPVLAAGASMPAPPTVNALPKVPRPPPGFEALDNKRPPGMTPFQRGPIYYVNNGPRPNPAAPPGILPTVPPGALYDPRIYNRPAYGQVPLNFAQQLNQYNYNQQMLLQQMLFMRSTGASSQWAQWPMGASALPSTYPANQSNQSPYQQPVINNNPVFQSQFKPQPNQYYYQNKRINHNKPFFQTTPFSQTTNFPQTTSFSQNTHFAQTTPVPQTTAFPQTSPLFQPTSVSQTTPMTTLSAQMTEEKVLNITEKALADSTLTDLGNSESGKSSPFESLDDVTSIEKSLPSSFVEKTSKTPTPPPTPALTPPPTSPGPQTETTKKTSRDEIGSLSVDLTHVCVSEKELTSGKDTARASDQSDVKKSETNVPLNNTTATASPEQNNNDSQPEAPKNSAVEDLKGDNEAQQKTFKGTGLPPKVVWKPLDVSVGIVHLLNNNNQAYISSNELAQVCLQLGGHSALAKILQTRGSPVPIQEFCREENEEFFASLDLCPAFSKIMLLEGNSKLNLIPLKNVVTALIAGGIKNPKVVFAFQGARRDFNPEDNYWKKKCHN